MGEEGEDDSPIRGSSDVADVCDLSLSTSALKPEPEALLLTLLGVLLLVLDVFDLDDVVLVRDV